MSGKTSPAPLTVPVSLRSFYGESPPKRSRLLEGSNSIRPAFKSLKDNLIKFDRKLSEPINGLELKEPEQQDAGEEPKNLDRDSPLPLKNLGNTCYENSIIQCLFSLNMFMDNFENSMKMMRRFVIKPNFTKSFDVPNQQQQQQLDQTNSNINLPELSSKTAESLSTITETDVRYRIADAFDNLYKSYTQKRIQIETNNKNNSSSNQQASPTLATVSHPKDQLNSTTCIASDSFTNRLIAACKSTEAGESSNAPTCSTEAQAAASIDTTTPTAPSTSTAATSTTTTDTAASNLTPIALVSSTAATSEQSEIETRLEDLKSAVGERSSQFNSTHQQDASEFFYHVIDSIQEFYQSLNKTKDEDNPVTKAFELELDYLIRCPKCHHRSMTEPEKIRTLPLALPHVNNESTTTSLANSEGCNHETNGAPTPPTSDLGLDSPQSNTSEEHKNGSDEKENQALVSENAAEENSNTMSIAKLDLTDKSNFENNLQENQTTTATPIQQQTKQHYSLHDALNNYFKDDLLDYSCSQNGCDSKQRTKKCLIRKLPQVLFITLARYSYTGKKNLDEIEAPIELSVPFLENKSPSHSPSAYRDFNDEDNNKYQLVAVVCHLGSSLNAGHYTSYVYNQNIFSWYSCDDDSITKVREEDVIYDATKSGYCFFYAHKSCINQKPSQQVQDSTSAENLRTLEGSDNVVVSSSVAESSVIMTPEASPKSSPSPLPAVEEKIEMHEDHSSCDRGNEIEGDWD